MHGLGNDFVVFDARRERIALDSASAKALADRRFGVGCDQVIVIGESRNGFDAAMRIYNADGGEVESCGNAARCVARLLMEEKDSDRVAIDLRRAGSSFCSEAGLGSVTVDMGAPRLELAGHYRWRTLWTPIISRSRSTGSRSTVQWSMSAIPIAFCSWTVRIPRRSRTLGPKIETHALCFRRASMPNSSA